MELTRCPECALVAEVVGRDVWPSTDGPVEHVHVRCVAGHRFLLPVAMLAANAPPEPVVARRRAPTAPGVQQP
ncbi:MAG TPA: hypothetical protein VLQ78_13610 [Ornithinibacter sp.]|nr:hypothetical protein [Ornithinibacter sp.]